LQCVAACCSVLQCAAEMGRGAFSSRHYRQHKSGKTKTLLHTHTHTHTHTYQLFVECVAVHKRVTAHTWVSHGAQVRHDSFISKICHLYLAICWCQIFCFFFHVKNLPSRSPYLLMSISFLHVKNLPSICRYLLMWIFFSCQKFAIYTSLFVEWVAMHKRVMAHTWVSHSAHGNESWHTYEYVMNTYEWVMARIWICHGTQMN